MRRTTSRAGSAGSPAATLKETSNLMSRILRGGLIAFLLMGVAASASADDLTGMAGVGIRAGGSYFNQGYNPERFETDAQGNFVLDQNGQKIPVAENLDPRLAGDLAFEYIWSDHVAIELSTSWAWSAIKHGSEAYQDSFYVTTSVPFLLSARYRMRHGKAWRPYVGGGAGGYWVSVLSKDLGPSKDPQTFQDVRRFVPGFYLTGGVEKGLTKTVTATGDLAYHYTFWEDKENFPSGLNGNKSYIQLRLGLVFHFSVSERIETGFPG
jgi:opacity protein-like surface antigen